MKIANIYSHLNGEEFLLCRKPNLYQEIKDAITALDANLYTKPSSDKTKKGFKLYDQKLINKEFERLLNPKGWKEKKVQYFVTGNLDVEKQIVNINDKVQQKIEIINAGCTPLITNNQVDFVKDRVAIEVQFGKYFSIAYDLHVKHTFFYLRDEIDVGIEIIPTRDFMRKMDTGIGWFENEVANVIREGRSNPTVPIVIIGIEPDVLFTEKFYDPITEANYQTCVANKQDFTNPFNEKVIRYKSLESENEEENDSAD